MSHNGQDIIDIGTTRIGQRYFYGVEVPLNNPAWSGPWDCAEFASWCAYQAYGLIFGAGGATRPDKATPYSGSWYAQAKKTGHAIDWREALRIPGAALIRAPTTGRHGHVAFSMGDGERTLEARGAAYGVNIFDRAGSRPWSIGCLLPGVDYETNPGAHAAPHVQPASAALSKEFLCLRTPNAKGADILAVQKALAAKGIHPGPLDGSFGPLTHAAVLSFQIMQGLEVDGVVGPATAKALGLAFPIAGSEGDARAYATASTPQVPGPIPLAPHADTFDGIAAITRSGKRFSATTVSGERFLIGSITTYHQDGILRTGLSRGGGAPSDSLNFGVYRAKDWVDTLGQWATFIEPTLSAESDAHFAGLNTYDRTAFTFGAPQLAAHTPQRNFVIYFRRLLALPQADQHFPELSLRPNNAGETTIHLQTDKGFVDLEQAESVTRPSGASEMQLVKLMAYLNASATAVDEAELLAAARLMNWLRLDPKAKELQIAVFLEHAQDNLAWAKKKVAGFTGSDWEIALWIMDIRHQGRGSRAEMSAALASANPVEALRAIGPAQYKSRVKKVAEAVAALKASGLLDGFTV